MYEKKVADLVKQSEVDTERSQRAEEHLHVLKNELNDLQIAFQQLQMENSRYKKILAETTQMYEGKIDGLTRQLDEEHSKFADAKEQLNLANKQEQKDSKELGLRINDMHQMLEATVNKLEALKSEYKDLQIQKEALSNEVLSLKHELMLEENRRKAAESELADSKQVMPENEDGFEEKRPYTKKDLAHASSSLGQRNIIAKICEEVGLQKILSLLTSGDLDVQIHAVKVVANLAAEDGNQEKIVNEGGLGALLILLESSQNTTILRVASGAIANLAMNELNQGLIVSKGGARLLASTAARTDDPQTLRMVAGAIANLCGNESLHIMLKEEGAIKALVGMTRSGNSDVIAQVARGMANFAKSESRGILQGNRLGRSPLIDDNALTWLITNSSVASSTARRHIELALCHLAQNENNAMDIVASGGLKELLRISMESSKEDIRNLAKKTLKANPIFRAELIS